MTSSGFKRFAVPTILAGLLGLSGCARLPGKQIDTRIDIAARPQVVWDILVDNPRYPEWNPYHVRVEGELALGRRLSLELHKPNGERVEIEPRVLRLDPGRVLVWGGGIRGLFFGEHEFLLQPLDDGGTRLIHREDFRGLAVPFASLDAIEEGYRLMNTALKRRAEGTP
jgi:hypothetical protein